MRIPAEDDEVIYFCRPDDVLHFYLQTDGQILVNNSIELLGDYVSLGKNRFTLGSLAYPHSVSKNKCDEKHSTIYQYEPKKHHVIRLTDQAIYLPKKQTDYFREIVSGAYLAEGTQDTALFHWWILR